MHTCNGADTGGTDICGLGRLSLARHTCRVKCGAVWIYPGGDIVNEAFAAQLSHKDDELCFLCRPRTV